MMEIYTRITGPVRRELFRGQRFNIGIAFRTLQIYVPNAGWGAHLSGNRFQQIFPVHAHNKLGALNVHETFINSGIVAGNAVWWMLCFRCLTFLFHVNVASTSSEGCCRCESLFFVSIVFSASARTLGRLRALELDLTCLDLAWLGLTRLDLI